MNKKEIIAKEFCVASPTREQAFSHEDTPVVGSHYRVVAVNGAPSRYVPDVWEMSVKLELVVDAAQKAETK